MNKQKSVLIIEDEKILQDVYKLILDHGGYQVHTANNGVEGMQKIKTVQPDLVLLDIFMPVMDGKELLRNVDLDEYPDMKVIVYSNLSDRTTETEVRNLGAHDFILKSSMTPKDLLAMTRRHLQ